MEVQKLTWKDVYKYMKTNTGSLFFYCVADKKYYSLTCEYTFYVHKVTNKGKVTKEKLVEFSHPDGKSFVDYMRHNYDLNNLVLSPVSQLRMCGSEAEGIEHSNSIRVSLRSTITKIIGESQFRSIAALFSDKGLKGNYEHIKVGPLENTLIAWIQEIQEGSILGIENIFLLYDQLSYPEYVRELCL